MDTIYYMVAEALGFRPGDLGLDYNMSWEKDGKAYEKAKLRLVVSESEGDEHPPMLGLMSEDCYRPPTTACHHTPEQQCFHPRTVRSSELLHDEFMTVAFRDGEGNAGGSQRLENYLYEVRKVNKGSGTQQATWRIVGVWIPVNIKVKRLVSGWFGPGARPDGKLI